MQPYLMKDLCEVRHGTGTTNACITIVYITVRKTLQEKFTLMAGMNCGPVYVSDKTDGVAIQTLIHLLQAAPFQTTHLLAGNRHLPIKIFPPV